PVVRIVNKYLILPAIDFLSKKGFVAILILLLITLFLKILLFPFSLHMQRVGERLKIINPLLQRLNEKYKDDQQRLIFEQAKLYRQYNVNPFSPLLGSFIQIPLIIAMFNAIPISMAFRGQKFLWCSDLSSYDSIIDFKFSIPFYGDHISLMSLLAVVVTTLFLFYEGRTMNTSKNSKIFIIMSILMMTWFSNNFCAALNIYYIMLGVFSFLNSYVVRKLTSSQNIEKNND
ncbi:MAG: membrane protein insertase YidC, partial [Cytophagales bacterium]|nr:membrane protein insertase YidC [Cytophagales bacterium]